MTEKEGVEGHGRLRRVGFQGAGGEWGAVEEVLYRVGCPAVWVCLRLRGFLERETFCFELGQSWAQWDELVTQTTGQGTTGWLVTNCCLEAVGGRKGE